MLIPVPPRYRKRRTLKPRGSTQTPTTVNQIVAVGYGEDPDGIVVTITGTLLNIDDLFEAFQVKVGEDWELPSSYDATELPVVLFTFGLDVSGATEWVVPDPGQWTFEDEQALVEPYAGEVG